MAPDRVEKHTARMRKQKKMDDLARSARSSDEVEAEAELLSSAEKVKPISSDKAPGRNDPCPCGSGRKYKKCCGAAGG